jgi:CheY-like chemotaxis protein
MHNESLEPDASGQRCVLIVEDDDDSREMLGELVSLYGYRPLAAANASEALAHARVEKLDVALIDIGLPEMDGCELARLLRQATAGLPTRLVALTGYSDGAIRDSAGAAGFDAYVVKPIMPEMLEALLSA